MDLPCGPGRLPDGNHDEPTAAASTSRILAVHPPGSMRPRRRIGCRDRCRLHHRHDGPVAAAGTVNQVRPGREQPSADPPAARTPGRHSCHPRHDRRHQVQITWLSYAAGTGAGKHPSRTTSTTHPALPTELPGSDGNGKEVTLIQPACTCYTISHPEGRNGRSSNTDASETARSPSIFHHPTTGGTSCNSASVRLPDRHGDSPPRKVTDALRRHRSRTTRGHRHRPPPRQPDT